MTGSADRPGGGERDRGISWTMDAIAMAVIIVGALLVAMQAAPTQSKEAVSEEFTSAQLRQDGQDVLSMTKATGELKDATLYWDDSKATWVDAGGDPSYVAPPAGHPLGRELREVVQQDGISYNVEVQYQTPSGAFEDRLMVYQGTPGEDAVVVSSAPITLLDSTSLHGPDAGTTVKASSSFYAPDAEPASTKYNTLRVYIILWRS